MRCVVGEREAKRGVAVQDGTWMSVKWRDTALWDDVERGEEWHGKAGCGGTCCGGVWRGVGRH